MSISYKKLPFKANKKNYISVHPTMTLRLHAADYTISTRQCFELWPLTCSFDKCYYEYIWYHDERLGPNGHDVDRTAYCAQPLVQQPRLLL